MAGGPIRGGKMARRLVKGPGIDGAAMHTMSRA